MSRRLASDNNGFFLLHALSCSFFLAAATALFLTLQLAWLDDRMIDWKMTAYCLAKKEYLVTQAQLCHEADSNNFSDNCEYLAEMNKMRFLVKRTIEHRSPETIFVEVHYKYKNTPVKVKLVRHICIKPTNNSS